MDKLSQAVEATKDVLRKTPLPVLIIIGCLVLGVIVLSVSKSSTPYPQRVQAPQTMICPACGGAGQIERPFTGIQDGPVIYIKQTCGICGGTGRITPPAE
jgi:hypothetical protein